MKMKRELEEAVGIELRRLEELLMNPVARKERRQVLDLLDDDFVEFGSSGRVWTKDATLEVFATETSTPTEIENFACHLLAQDLALVTYHALQRCEPGERATTLRSSIWRRDSSAWRIRFHQGTPAA